MEEKKTTFKEKLIAFWSIKRNKIITASVGVVLIVGIILAIVLPIVLPIQKPTTSNTSAGNNSSASQQDEITNEIWNKAFEDVLNNFTYKITIDNTVRGLFELNETGFHGASFDQTGSIMTNKEEYIEWTADKNYTYSYSSLNKKWVKEETASDYATKEYQINYVKVGITFIGRFSDFKYDASKGGYFASATKTSVAEVEGEEDGGYEVVDVLVKFSNNKITEINFTVNDAFNYDVPSHYSVVSIGSTTFAFPTISE